MVKILLAILLSLPLCTRAQIKDTGRIKPLSTQAQKDTSKNKYQLSHNRLIDSLSNKDTTIIDKKETTIKKNSQIEITIDKWLAIGIGIVSLIVTVTNYYIQITLVKANRDIARFEDAYKKWTDKDFVDAREWIYNSLATEYPNPGGKVWGYYNLTDNKQGQKLRSVSFFFDYVGMMMHRRLINKDLFYDFWGKTTVNNWLKIEPYLRKQRITSGEDYQEHFENLAYTCLHYKKGNWFKRTFKIFRDKELKKMPVGYGLVSD